MNDFILKESKAEPAHISLRKWFDWCSGLISTKEFTGDEDYFGHGRLVNVAQHSYHDERVYEDGYSEFYYIGD